MCTCTSSILQWDQSLSELSHWILLYSPSVTFLISRIPETFQSSFDRVIDVQGRVSSSHSVAEELGIEIMYFKSWVQDWEFTRLEWASWHRTYNAEWVVLQASPQQNIVPLWQSICDRNVIFRHIKTDFNTAKFFSVRFRHFKKCVSNNKYTISVWLRSPDGTVAQPHLH